ncbi:MAG: chorismate synthase [Opitutales bacterium]|nr:chorismate synthase [Opitutales bacterium]
MSGNIFGRNFRVASFGESHGAAIGCVIDGCPSKIRISEEMIQVELDRRRPGQSDISTPRKEADKCRILSGVMDGLTLGTPIAILIENTNQKSSDYSEIAKLWRPVHADFTYDAKFGIRDPRGGGRSSARETAARVAAGAIAKKCLGNVVIRAWVESVHSISAPNIEGIPSSEEIEASPIRCPHAPTAARMVEFIKKTKAEGDSVGGIIRCRIANVPVGLGDPVFDRLAANLAKAMLSMPACKGFEIGSGFAGTRMFGSAHNDEFFVDSSGKVSTKTNYAGGVLGGISNGQVIDFRLAFKPTATILKEQDTVNKQLEPAKVIGRGRHDPCVLPRAVPIVEAMAALVLVDAALEANLKLPLE